MYEREFTIAGVKFRPNWRANIQDLEEGQMLTLEAEPDNQFDSNAVKILNGDVHLGYVPAKFAPEIAARLEHDLDTSCILSGLDKDGESWTACVVKVFEPTEEEGT